MKGKKQHTMNFMHGYFIFYILMNFKLTFARSWYLRSCAKHITQRNFTHVIPYTNLSLFILLLHCLGSCVKKYTNAADCFTKMSIAHNIWFSISCINYSFIFTILWKGLIFVYFKPCNSCISLKMVSCLELVQIFVYGPMKQCIQRDIIVFLKCPHFVLIFIGGV